MTKLIQGAAVMMAGLFVTANLTAGEIDGKKAHSVVIKGHSTDVWNLDLKGGELFQLSLLGDGDTDLDLYIEDAFGNLLARSDGTTDRESIRYKPAFTGKYKIKVINRSKTVANHYLIAWN